MDPRFFAVVAGEASGDLLAALLLEGFAQRWPNLRTAGIGGPRMADQGFDAWWPSQQLAVRGYWEVLRHYRRIVGVRSELKRRLLSGPRPAVFIGVDAPDFNLSLEADLKGHGIKTVHFVCPSIWAWRADRVQAIRRSVDHVLCIFPFEPALLEEHGIASTYVGHPLASTIPVEPDRLVARTQLGFSPEDTVVAVLPGSRESEIQYLAKTFFQAAQCMLRERPEIKFAVPAMTGLRSAIEAAAREAGFQLEAPALKIVDGQSHAVLAACDVTLIASGTATLEAALFKRPMVIAYKMNALSWQIMRRQKLQPWVGLPNILCADQVVPEFLQDAATPQALAHAVLTWLDEPAKAQAMAARFAELHQTLSCDTPQLATDAIQTVLAR